MWWTANSVFAFLSPGDLHGARPHRSYALAVVICRHCDADNPDHARFCLRCGVHLASTDDRPDARKVVTVVFTDIVGSTTLGEQLDPERLRGVLDTYFARMRSVLEQHEALLEKFVGDAIMAVFGVPRLHEDDALRAVLAADRMREELHQLNARLLETYGVTMQARIGVSTGEVLVGKIGEGQALALGDAVNVAARLEQAAGPDEILINEATYALVRHAIDAAPLAPLSVKGKSHPIPAYRVLRVTRPAASSRRIRSPLVGREAELSALERCFDRALTTRSCERVTLSGPPGVGKSRLAQDFIEGLTIRPTIVQGRCLAYGAKTSFWALGEALRDAISATDDDSRAELSRKLYTFLSESEWDTSIGDRLGPILGISDAVTSLDEVSWAVRSFLELLARRRPTILLLDDLQWADRALLEIVHDIHEWVSDAPLLLLCLCRPELTAGSPAESHTLGEVVRLEPLSDQNTHRLVRNLLEEAEIPAALSARVIEIAEGNPLFVEQLLEKLVDEGRLTRQDGRWIVAGNLESVRIPPTIRALLAARLDLLESTDRDVVASASVIGRIFPRDAVIELTTPELRHLVSAQLNDLVRRDLICVDRQATVDDLHRFSHLLIRDAAYDALPKSSRAFRHERFAAWLRDTAGDRVGELEAILGYHLEQAYLYRAELGPLQQPAIDVGRQAAHWLSRAARRMGAIGDVAAAARHLRRACQLLTRDDPGYRPLQLELGDALLQSGDLNAAAEVISAVRHAADDAGATADSASAQVLELLARFTLDPEGAAATIHREFEPLRRIFSSLGDERGLARTWRLRAHVDVIRCQFGAAAQAIRRAADHARAAGDQREERDNLCWLVITSIWGSMPAKRALIECGDALMRAGGDRKLEATALLGSAVVQAMQGHHSEAQRLIRRAGAIVEELGSSVFTVVARAQMGGYAYMYADDPEAAEREELRSFSFLEGQEDKVWLSTLAAMLGQATLAQHRLSDADRYARIAEAICASDDLDAQIRWRGVRAGILLRTGQLDAAAELAREAVRLAETTDFVDDHAESLVVLGDVLSHMDRQDGAVRALEQAARLYERKGNIVSARKTRASIAVLTSS